MHLLVPARLTQRDLNILVMAYEYDGVTIQHIRRRFFPNSRSHTSCSERVSRLVQAGYLRSHRLPPVSGVGSGPLFFTLDRGGRPLVAKALGLSEAELARATRKAAHFVLRHHLALCDLRLSLELAVQRSPEFTIIDWVGDRQLVLETSDPNGEGHLQLIPDASLTLMLSDGREEVVYIEMDMGTTSRRRVRTKLRAYLSLAEPSRRPVLWIVPGEERRAAVALWAREEAQHLDTDPSLFWLSRLPILSEHTVFDAPVWHIVGGPAVALKSMAAGIAQSLSAVAAPAPSGGRSK